MAALGVLVFHVAGNTDVTPHAGVLNDFLARLGNYGVTIFFVLSGFLLYRQFVLAEFRGTRFPRPVRFYWHRFLRIYPAYWVAVTVVIFTVSSRGKINGFSQWLSIYSLMQNYRSDVFLSGLFVAWTLCIEVAFYLVLPPLAWAIRKLGDLGPDDGANNVHRRLKVHLAVFAVMIIVANIYRYWAITAGEVAIKAGPIRWLPAYLDWYAYGMAAALVSVWAAMGYRVLPSIKAVVSAPWLCVGIGVALYAIMTTLNMPHDYHEAETGVDLLHYDLNGLSALFLLLPGFLGPQDRGWIRKVLGSAPAAALGLISYGIYLYHPIAIDRLNTVWKPEHRGSTPNFWIVLGLVLAFSVVCATLSYVIVERPTMKLKDPDKLLAKYRARRAG